MCGGVIYQRSMFCIGFPYSMVDWKITESLRWGFSRSSRYSGCPVNGDSEVLFSSLFVSGSFYPTPPIWDWALDQPSHPLPCPLLFHSMLLLYFFSPSSFNSSNAQEAVPFFSGRSTMNTIASIGGVCSLLSLTFKGNSNSPNFKSQSQHPEMSSA